MTALKKSHLISIEDYLASEELSEIKHEYLGGETYAMAAEILNHSAISGNITGKLHAKLKGGPYCSLGSLARLRIELLRETRFYYPDAQVVRLPIPGAQLFTECPVVIAEVLSESTRRIDTVEKKDAYLAIPSLQVLMLVDLEERIVTVSRRTPASGFKTEYHEGSGIIPLPEIGTELSLDEIYKGVDFA